MLVEVVHPIDIHDAIYFNFPKDLLGFIIWSIFLCTFRALNISSKFDFHCLSYRHCDWLLFIGPAVGVKIQDIYFKEINLMKSFWK